MISFIFWHFLVPKLFLVNFEIFLITGLKDNEFRFFAHNFFKNGPNSKFFLLKFLLFFSYFLEKNTKNYLKCFYMRFLILKILNCILKLYVLFEFFDNIYILNFYSFYKFQNRVDSGLKIITIFFSIFENFEKILFAINLY